MLSVNKSDIEGLYFFENAACRTIAEDTHAVFPVSAVVVSPTNNQPIPVPGKIAHTKIPAFFAGENTVKANIATSTKAKL